MSDQYLIELKDVRVGDTIMAVWHLGDLESTKKGVVGKISGYNLLTAGTYTINFDEDRGVRPDFLYLLDRPAGPPEDAQFKQECDGKTTYYKVDGGRVKVTYNGVWINCIYSPEGLLNRIAKGEIVVL